jgi:uncharacterized protein YjbI with pentapeptide repeats
MSSDVEAFSANPNVDTWSAVHADILKDLLTPEADSLLVNALASKSLPEPIFDAAVADLSQADFLTTFVLLRELNIMSRNAIDTRDASVVSRTSKISWMLLSLRPSDDKSSINATNMDLLFGGDFVGQGMNLMNVDFSGAKLPGGVWRGSDLTGATFDAATTDSQLVCRDCTWGNVSATLHLVDGRWLAIGAREP